MHISDLWVFESRKLGQSGSIERVRRINIERREKNVVTGYFSPAVLRVSQANLASQNDMAAGSQGGFRRISSGHWLSG